MFGLIKNVRRTVAMLKFSIVWTVLLSAFVMVVVMLPEDLTIWKQVIGWGSLAVFVIAWTLTAIFWQKAKHPLREAKKGVQDIAKKCAVKYRGAKDKIVECIFTGQ